MGILGLMFRGMAMGVAEVIPGVSGGSIALITNIYERLLNAINSFNLGLINVFKSGGVNAVFEKVDGKFLLQLFMGMGVGILFGIFVVSHMMDNYPELLWGFFFGLILASSILIFKMIKGKTGLTWILFLLGAIIAYGITMITPQGGSTNLVYVFICGMIAISALILPGVSGSFILLLLGMYTVIIKGLKELLTQFSVDKLILISVFALGCLVGLKVFSKLVSWTYTKYKNNTLAILTGFMLGSLNKIWPWKTITSILDKESGSIMTAKLDAFMNANPEGYKILTERNIIPLDDIQSHTIPTIALFLLAIVLITIFDRYNKIDF